MSLRSDENEVLQTERLILERFTLRHAAFMLELINSPGWLQYIGDRGIRDLNAAEEYIRQGPMMSYAQYGYGFYAVSLKADRTTIGGCGLIKRQGLAQPDIGFALLPEYTGKGYASEIATATLTYAREILEIKEVLAITLPNNSSSIRLLERIGLRYQEMIRLPGDQEELMLYRISFK